MRVEREKNDKLTAEKKETIRMKARRMNKIHETDTNRMKVSSCCYADFFDVQKSLVCMRSGVCVCVCVGKSTKEI